MTLRAGFLTIRSGDPADGGWLVLDMFIVLGLVVFLLFLQVGLYCWERKMVWPYGERTDRPHVADPTGYGSRRVMEAMQCGFEFFGWAPDVKGKIYNVSYAFLASSEGDCVAVVGIGKILSHQLEATWLHSPSQNGRDSHCSTDNQTGIQLDPSGTWKTQLTPRMSFVRMLAKHREWVHNRGALPMTFVPGRQIEQFRAAREEHVRWLSELGFIVFCDPDRTRWRYTLFAAAKLAVLAYSIGILRALTLGRFPRTA